MKRFLRDLKEKDQVQSYFLVAEKNSGQDRNGKSFLSLMVSDASGSMNARMFERVDEQSDGFVQGEVAWIKGFVQVFHGRKQLIVHEIRRADASEYTAKDVLGEWGGDSTAHMKVLKEVVATLKNPWIRDLLAKTLEDPKIEALMLTAPAAKTIHHAYKGGLVEHIHSIVNVMQSVASHYAFLDLDLLIFGAIYHDLGKIFELEIKDGIRYTTPGRLVGHMAIACEMIDQKASELAGFPSELRDVLKHIVLSHHGKLEYGSPKLPMLAEAIVVNMIDDLDSKLNTLYFFLKGEVEQLPPQENWSHYHSGFERYFYLDFFRRRLPSSVAK
jgi:3'-5' exoribonuclease